MNSFRKETGEQISVIQLRTLREVTVVQQPVGHKEFKNTKLKNK